MPRKSYVYVFYKRLFSAHFKKFLFNFNQLTFRDAKKGGTTHNGCYQEAFKKVLTIASYPLFEGYPLFQTNHISIITGKWNRTSTPLLFTVSQ